MPQAPPERPADGGPGGGEGGGTRRGRQTLGPGDRLRRRQDFLRAYRSGRRRGGRFATLFYVPNETGTARLGITASRKVGKSVVRQRLKRRVREIYRRWERRSSLPPLDLVVNLKPEAREADFASLRRDLERQLAAVLPGARQEERRPRRGGRRPAAERGPAR